MTHGEQLRLIDELYQLRARIKRLYQQYYSTDQIRRQYELEVQIRYLEGEEQYLRHLLINY